MWDFPVSADNAPCSTVIGVSCTLRSTATIDLGNVSSPPTEEDRRPSVERRTPNTRSHPIWLWTNRDARISFGSERVSSVVACPIRMSVAGGRDESSRCSNSTVTGRVSHRDNAWCIHFDQPLGRIANIVRSTATHWSREMNAERNSWHWREGGLTDFVEKSQFNDYRVESSRRSI